MTKVNDDAYVAGVGFGEQVAEVVHCAVLAVDCEIINHIVAVIGGRGVNGHEPDGVYAQALQVVEIVGDAVEVADAVPVTVAERAHENFVKNGIPPPFVLCGCGGGARTEQDDE
jgi:hypothetical protein